MSPVTRVGPWCRRCKRGAAMPDTGICRSCELLGRAFPWLVKDDPPELEEFGSLTNRDIWAWLEQDAA